MVTRKDVRLWYAYGFERGGVRNSSSALRLPGSTVHLYYDTVPGASKQLFTVIHPMNILLHIALDRLKLCPYVTWVQSYNYLCSVAQDFA